MTHNPHASAARAYLEELCAMLRAQRRLRRPRGDWWNPPLVVPAAMGLAVGAAGCGGSVVGNQENTGQREICTDKVDNDGDGLTDCADPDCPSCSVALYSAPSDAAAPKADAKPPAADAHAPDGPPPWQDAADEPPAAEVGPSPELCDDKVDNDLDGLIDCLDPDCAQQCKCAAHEDCLSEADDDCDGKVNCDDNECAAVQCCMNTAYGGPMWGELCFNGLDDDCDGLLDCEDPKCMDTACCSMSDYAAPIPGPENCTVPDDEDCDGMIDCQDPDCASVCGGDAYSAPQK